MFQGTAAVVEPVVAELMNVGFVVCVCVPQ